MTNLMREVVVVINSPVEGKEFVAFRVSVRQQQILDSVAKTCYCHEIFKVFMTEACKIHDLVLDECTAEIIFPYTDSIREAVQSDMPSDLLRVRTGMFTADLADRMFLLH